MTAVYAKDIVLGDYIGWSTITRFLIVSRTKNIVHVLYDDSTIAWVELYWEDELFEMVTRS